MRVDIGRHSRLLLALMLIGPSAMGGLNGISVRIMNDGAEDIPVTVYDTSTEPRGVVLDHQRINGFTAIPIALVPDATGRANLAWTAVSADPHARRCGHAQLAGVSDAASVAVRTDGACESG